MLLPSCVNLKSFASSNEFRKINATIKVQIFLHGPFFTVNLDLKIQTFLQTYCNPMILRLLFLRLTKYVSALMVM